MSNDPTPDEDQARLREVAVERARRASNYSWRVEHFEALFAHLPVSEGHLKPSSVVPIMLRSIPGLAELFEVSVPDEYVAVDLNDGGYSAATIACPCGATHEVEIGGIVHGECGRAFFWFGDDVRVAKFDATDTTD